MSTSTLPLAAQPVHAPHPGGIAVIDVGAADATPLVSFEGRRVLTLERDGRVLAVVGLPLDQPPGEARLAIESSEQTQTFAVLAHEYPAQHLTVKPTYVNPGETALARIAAERERINAALARFSERPVGELRLAAPLPGRRSSSFGSRRFFNEEPRAPHRGMDIAGSTGDAIRAPLAGTVALQGDFYFTGNTVILDHGQGLLTLYAHLDDTAVAAGDRVEAGARIGSVGATGRVTGPHLHFATYLNGTPVDPALLIDAPE